MSGLQSYTVSLIRYWLQLWSEANGVSGTLYKYFCSLTHFGRIQASLSGVFSAETAQWADRQLVTGIVFCGQ